MKTRAAIESLFCMLAGLLLAASVSSFAQSGGQISREPVQMQSETLPGVVPVASGQGVTVEGVIVRRDPDSFMLQNSRGMNYVVTLSNSTEVIERKSNPFRDPKIYAVTELLRGLSVEVKGRGDSSGAIQAEKVKFRDEDLRVAQSLRAGIHPVEQQLKQAESRLSQSEQNQQRLSGQVDEFSAISNAALNGAKTAQESADAAARSADTARSGIRATNERISALDDFDVREEVTVNFPAGSTLLSKIAKEHLDRIAESVKVQKGFMIEVSGYASSDGSETLNQRLSQRRADAVIQYLAENYEIPIRRFVTPFGYGDKEPIADNKTHFGREQNRRVEVRILVNKGLTQSTTTNVSKAALGPAS